MKLIDETGNAYGRLKVIRQAGRVRKEAAWLCACECGQEKVIPGYALRSGNTRSCGCLSDESRRKPKTHGLSYHPLHRIWDYMRNRVLNPNNLSYHNYGGRGITICPEWDSFINFYSWATSNGWAAGLKIDRIDNSGDYSPRNCRFVDHSTSVINRRKLKSNTSGYVGVSFNKRLGKFVSAIGVERLGGSQYLGCFDTVEEAVAARNSFIQKHKLQHKIQVVEHAH